MPKDRAPPPESSHIRAAGRRVCTWNDALWKQVRQLDGVQDNFLEENVSFSNLKAGGGKGGDLMCFTRDFAYIVKELSDGDHDSLLRLARGLVEHLLKADTLMASVYLHFQQVETGRRFFVMRNMLPWKGPWAGRYDLKGCADDKTLELDGRRIQTVRKRIWNVGLWIGHCAPKLCWSEARNTYKNGKRNAHKLKLQLTPTQREVVLRCLERDVAWLQANNLMDYSIIIGQRRLGVDELAKDHLALKALRAPQEELLQPIGYKEKDGVCLLYIGVIDYLQQWTSSKKIARCIKVLECNKATVPPRMYGHRFLRHFSKLFEGSAEPYIVPPAAIGGTEEGNRRGGAAEDNSGGLLDTCSLQ